MPETDDERQREIDRVARVNEMAGDWVEFLPPHDVIVLDLPPEDPEAANSEDPEVA